MNLALRDIQHSPARFLLTAVGVGMLLMIIMGMSGIYRGLVEDATELIDRLDADLWIVQQDTRGPFAEISRVTPALRDRVAAAPGVKRARKFLFHTIQRPRGSGSMRLAVVGLDWPVDRGEWLPMLRGRTLGQAHFELVADRSTGLGIGERVRLASDVYTVVGITTGLLASGGDGVVCVSMADAQAIQNHRPGEAVRLDREARAARGQRLGVEATQPALLERGIGASTNIPALGPPPISAVLVQVEAGVDPEQVARAIGRWEDVSVFSRTQQRDLLLRGVVDRARRQIGLFRALLAAISALILALILYTMTLDKLRSIAILKLIGAPNHTILALILQQSLVLGVAGYVLAYVGGAEVFPLFPRRVILTDDDLLYLGFAVLALSVVGSLLGIWRALKVRPGEAIG